MSCTTNGERRDRTITGKEEFDVLVVEGAGEGEEAYEAGEVVAEYFEIHAFSILKEKKPYM